VIDTATNTVIGSPITVGTIPYGVAVTRDGSKVYVANEDDNTVSVIHDKKYSNCHHPCRHQPYCPRHLHPAATNICWDARV
jgi:DNA-binding beta-propeller fold protein YncE